MNERSARPANELQEDDFRVGGVWRFVTPDEMERLGVDESYVVLQADSPRAGQYGSYLMAARYELRNGSVLPGVVDVGILEASIEFSPSAVFAAGKRVDPLGRDTESRLQRLLQTKDAQPIRWHLKHTLGGEAQVRTGSIGKSGLSQVLGLLAQLARLRLSRRGGREA